MERNLQDAAKERVYTYVAKRERGIVQSIQGMPAENRKPVQQMLGMTWPDLESCRPCGKYCPLIGQFETGANFMVIDGRKL